MPDLKRSAESGKFTDSASGPSRALLAAQQRLEQLRAARQAPRRTAVAIFRPLIAAPPYGHGQSPAQVLPSQADGERAGGECWQDQGIREDHSTATIRLQPALALAILDAKQAPAGRIWLLLRFLDRAGRGWLAADAVREQLARKESPLFERGDAGNEGHVRVCGRRQLRNLLNRGEGLFWERPTTRAGTRPRIWLRSQARVAAALGLERLSGRPVEIPLPVLLSGTGQVRAHFYASFHGGRQVGEASGAPISRSSLAKITHVPPRTQRLYDRAAGVQRQANYAVGAEYTSESIQERAWQHGKASFKFIDHQGKQGPAGRRYVAWRLPNSYSIAAVPEDKRKRNNRQPVDLVTIGAQGNDRSPKRCPRQPKTLFHLDGSKAGKAYNRDCSLDAYWPEPGQPTKAVKMWQVIGRSTPRRSGNLLPGL